MKYDNHLTVKSSSKHIALYKTPYMQHERLSDAYDKEQNTEYVAYKLFYFLAPILCILALIGVTGIISSSKMASVAWLGIVGALVAILIVAHLTMGATKANSERISNLKDVETFFVRFAKPGNNPSAQIIEDVANHPLTKDDFFSLLYVSHDLTGNQVGEVIRKQYECISSKDIVTGKKIWVNKPLPTMKPDEVFEELEYKYSEVLEILNTKNKKHVAS